MKNWNSLIKNNALVNLNTIGFLWLSIFILFSPKAFSQTLCKDTLHFNRPSLLKRVDTLNSTNDYFLTHEFFLSKSKELIEHWIQDPKTEKNKRELLLTTKTKFEYFQALSKMNPKEVYLIDILSDLSALAASFSPYLRDKSFDFSEHELISLGVQEILKNYKSKNHFQQIRPIFTFASIYDSNFSTNSGISYRSQFLAIANSSFLFNIPLQNTYFHGRLGSPIGYKGHDKDHIKKIDEAHRLFFSSKENPKLEKKKMHDFANYLDSKIQSLKSEEERELYYLILHAHYFEAYRVPHPEENMLSVSMATQAYDALNSQAIGREEDIETFDFLRISKAAQQLESWQIEYNKQQ